MRKLNIIAVLLLVTGSALAQDVASTRGFAVGIGLNGTAWKITEEGDESDTESGGGLGLDLSYGFNELITAYLHADAASIKPENADAYPLAHVDLGAQFNLLQPTSKIRPFVRGALTGYVASMDEGSVTVESSGAGLTIGAGARYFVSPPLALVLAIDVTPGQINEVSTEGVSVETELSTFATRFGFGLTWFPGR